MESTNLERARANAKQLLAGLARAQPEALSRIHASHPKFAGRPVERTEGWAFSLADAQATVAVEEGYVSWADLNLALNPRETVTPGFSDIERRAFAEAQQIGHRYLLADHFLLALLKPARSTPTLEALKELGLAYDELYRKVAQGRRRRRNTKGARSSIPSHSLVGFARGIGVGLGAGEVSDEHVLLAFVFEVGFQRHLEVHGVDPLEVLSQLARRGVTLPVLDPPPLEAPSGPYGSWVYVPWEMLGEVTQRRSELFPPGSAMWGFNKSKWKKGYWYVHGEDVIPMEELAREVVVDRSEIVVLSDDEGTRAEAEGAKMRYRDSP